VCVRVCVHACVQQSVRPNLLPGLNLVLSALELPAHVFRALESCRHSGGGRVPCCLVTSSRAPSAANARAGEQYQVKAQYQVRANALLARSSVRACRGDQHGPPLYKGQSISSCTRQVPDTWLSCQSLDYKGCRNPLSVAAEILPCIPVYCGGPDDHPVET